MRRGDVNVNNLSERLSTFMEQNKEPNKMEL
jgi:hypothetical protein